MKDKLFILTIKTSWLTIFATFICGLSGYETEMMTGYRALGLGITALLSFACVWLVANFIRRELKKIVNAEV